MWNFDFEQKAFNKLNSIFIALVISELHYSLLLNIHIQHPRLIYLFKDINTLVTISVKLYLV